MKKTFSIILSIAIGLSAFGAADVYDYGKFPSLAAFADEPSNPASSTSPTSPTAPSAPVSNEITAENITLEYETITYNGAIRKPAITVTLGETALQAGTDYSILYPENCTDIGEKTVTISGKGNYTGSANALYTITPLDCTDNPEVVIEANDCRYNGLPQYPEISVKYGGYVIPEENYTLTLSDNTEVSVGNKAQCTVIFHGNCTGERTAEFSVLKSDPDDFEIDLTAKAGQTLSIDLTSMKPTGAILGNPVFLSSDFSPNNQPKIAFNMLKFTLSPTLKSSTSIAIPMTNIVNSEDYWLEFYIEPVDAEKPIPQLLLNPIVKEYDGKPITVKDLIQNGSTARVNGNTLEGKWRFTTPSRVPTMPCDKVLLVAEFIPDDPQYSNAYGMVQATILRMDAPDFNAKANPRKIYPGETSELSVTGIPEDFDGSVTISAKENDEFFVLSETKTENGADYELDFPFEDAYHTLKVTLAGSAIYAPKTIELKIKVGNPPAEPPADAATTEQELSELIGKAEAATTVKANKIKLISAELLREAAAKRLTIEVKANDNITFILEPAKMNAISTLNLTAANAVIPQVLLDKLGDEELYSFTSFARCEGGVTVRASVKSELPIACLYLYNTSGELEHITSVPIKGAAVEFKLPSTGKYALTASRVSHIFRDFDNDCMITFEDVSLAIDLFLQINGKPSEEQLNALDGNGDGCIDFDDINVFLDYYLSLC